MRSGAGVWQVLVVAAAITVAVCYKVVVHMSPIQPLPVTLPPPPPASGPFTPNGLLRTHLRRIGEGLILNPEDVTTDGHGFLYAGCTDGWIKRVHPSTNSVQDWVFLGVGHRPNGVAVGGHGELIVCDPDMGLLNVTQESIEILTQAAQGVKFKIVNAVAVSTIDGSIYFTDSSDKYPVARLSILEARPDARLLKYDPVSRTTSVLMEGLFFANGVALSSAEDFLVVCETVLARCHRYWLKGEKAGHAEIFIDNLPGFPDNIKNDGKGCFWLALVLARRPYMNVLLKYPFLKQLTVVLGLTERLFNVLRKSPIVLAITEEGVPLSMLGDPTGAAIYAVTTAIAVGDDLYLGSLAMNFLGHIKLNATMYSSMSP